MRVAGLLDRLGTQETADDIGTIGRFGYSRRRSHQALPLDFSASMALAWRLASAAGQLCIHGAAWFLICCNFAATLGVIVKPDPGSLDGTHAAASLPRHFQPQCRN